MLRLPIALVALFLATPAPAQTADNPEMAKLFAEDQAVRKNVKPEQYKDMAFVRRMIADDAARRARTRTLLDTGKLTTAEDYYAAAFVFQHGGKPEDYLLAHTLALAAAARGRKDASWIAAATLDRYLQSIGQKQIYGTQFGRKGDAPMSQEPYDRTLIPDALRTALGVPVQAEQDKRLADMQAK
ncbi:MULTISPECIES: hypothetical protein [unclassified Sphingomonas]|uniref:hypothetical protein n=1 Tax=unclassified Sphingomonas TaxID=196159 RepID=UPI0006FEA227|nr:MULTISPECIES: hypothetical protein [unclassified Sphingomonas]KQM57819.1 hypothetical protein ASE65_11620 [Sphingomonas sp. Leaf16]KQN12894.1 hypothetical protein ASE81_06190 [Sphingomonas sp. Leaf29]KQN19782.1 hypothetical protein ASE83_06115 [Sphingomonas sp. Leaf32]